MDGDGDGYDGGDGGFGWISAASGRGCCTTSFFSATFVANLISGPSRKLLGLRRRMRWHLVRARSTGRLCPYRALQVPFHLSFVTPLTW